MASPNHSTWWKIKIIVSPVSASSYAVHAVTIGTFSSRSYPSWKGWTEQVNSVTASSNMLAPPAVVSA